MSNQGHWVGVKANPHDYFGFIYLIEDLTSGKKYVGKKQYWKKKAKAKGCKSAIANPQSPRWKPSCWADNQWRTYKGSSKNLDKWRKAHPDHEYRYTILYNCISRGETSYNECKEMWKRGVLEAWDEERQEHIYFNMQIPAIRFRRQRFE